MSPLIIQSLKPCTSPALSILRPRNAENIDEGIFKPNNDAKKYEVSFGCVA